VEERLAEISSGMRSATESARRVVFDLAPADLSAGLLAALRAAGDRFFVDTDTSIAFDGDDLQLDPTRMQLVYRVLVEALSNARRHARAHEVRVRLDRHGNM
jgi:two-component system sensor histidine kinase DegS